MAHSNFPQRSSAASSGSASTSYAHDTHYVYDVFVNHRGPDCKETFATDLHKRLSGYGLRVFLDEQELQRGEDLTSQIKGAIREASVHIAVFSKNYAGSKWCLEELELMLESKKIILPVFYDGINPSDLRWTRGDRGVYARALAELENKKTVGTETHPEKPRYPFDTIEKWRQALSDAADISGFELAKYKGDRHQLVEVVVEEVLRKVKRPVHVSKHPIGLDQKVRDFETTVSLQPQSRETRVIGIVGLGGIGKTTLAKEIFNRQHSKYDRSCRLSDVRGIALKSSQSKLLADLARWSGQIDDIDDGIGKIKQYLPCDPPALALLIIDDVDHIDQLNALLVPVKEKVKSGSLILITSRNEDVLASCGIGKSSIYKLKGLNPQHSQELFCWHAFGQSHPLERFARLVEGFFNACDGLPLSLEVIGALLCGKDDLRDWEEQLSEVSKSPPEDIKSRLKISFDGLNEQEKKIFLDVACFFIGEDSNTAVRIWIGSGWSGWLGLRKLENRSLAEVDSEGCIRMHDHLRDLGRDLAEKETPHRFWHQTDTLVQELYGQSPVRGISMVQRYGSEWSDPQLFKTLAAEDRDFQLIKNMSSLQLLRAEGDCVESIFKISGSQKALFSPKLVWLCWHSCPFTSLPPWIPLNKLTVLEITGNNLETLWRDVSQAPLQLRELNINAPLSQTPKFIGKMKNLEVVVLHRNERVEEADLKVFLHELCQLKILKRLVLKNCLNMNSLPDSIGNLTSLDHIGLSGCSNLQSLPDSFFNLTSLKHIDLSGCSNLQSLQDSIGNLTSLECIDLSGCSNLQSLPDSFFILTSLEHIDLNGCSNLQSLQDSFVKLTSLDHIDLSGCSNLQSLPDSFFNLTSLKYIDLCGCSNLQSLPDSFSNLTSLEYIDLSGCSNLQSLPDSFFNLTSLEHINLSDCSNLQSLPDSFFNLTSFEHILSGCRNLQRLPNSFGKLSNLQLMDLSECSS